ncbi:helix-turn-helix transcriptional regulator [Microvirga sp. KLBC 81]|uniref:helix-turn-helix domain-containing protein n=1 Tax=Microvirga sp. KLBC 81 TaxID=1862707 RepID=UPI0014026FDA|nr:helix-turn-helix transcriptional regulator [Microvirga sp. KLBC 81]
MKLVRIAVAGTQAALCKKTGIKPQTWNQYERGRSRIPIDTAIEFARIYDVDLHWLYMGGPLEESRFPQQLRDAIREAARREAEISESVKDLDDDAADQAAG